MKTIELIHKIHETDKNTEKCVLRKSDPIFKLAPNNLLC